jgi:hypothetical protein
MAKNLNKISPGGGGMTGEIDAFHETLLWSFSACD